MNPKIYPECPNRNVSNTEEDLRVDVAAACDPDAYTHYVLAHTLILRDLFAELDRLREREKEHRKEINEAIREEQRAAQAGYAEGQQSERERQDLERGGHY